MFGDRENRKVIRLLRAQRAAPPAGLVQRIGEAVQPRVRPARRRFALAFVVPVLILVLLSAFGGLGYASVGTEQAVTAVRHLVVPAKRHKLVVIKRSAAHSQYGGHQSTICHHGHTITVDEHALPAHLAHGDHLGACPAH